MWIPLDKATCTRGGSNSEDFSSWSSNVSGLNTFFVLLMVLEWCIRVLACMFLLLSAAVCSLCHPQVFLYTLILGLSRSY